MSFFAETSGLVDAGSTVDEIECKVPEVTVAADRQAGASRKIVFLLVAVICAGVLVRCYNVNTPLLERHIGRQYDTAAIARNFSEARMNILYPQINWRGDTPGYVESEFAGYTYTVAVLYKIFGVHEVIGRLLNISLFAIAAVFLFLLVRRIYNDRSALMAVLFYTFIPLSFIFSRTFQPDTMICLACLAGVYCFWRWTEAHSYGFLIASTMFVTLALATKPTSAFLAMPLIYLAHRQMGWSFLRRKALWAAASVAAVLPLLWYHHVASFWVTYGNSMIRFFVSQGKLYWLDENALWLLWPEVLRNIGKYVTTPAGLLLFAVGMSGKPAHRNYLLHYWAGGMAIIAMLAARQFWGHDYYLLPFTFVAVAWMGHGAVLLWDQKYFRPLVVRVLVVVLTVGVIGATLYKIPSWTTIYPQSWARVEFARRLERMSSPADLVIILEPTRPNWRPAFFEHRTGDGDYMWGFAVDLYLSHRYGWAPCTKEAPPQVIDRLHRRGARYVATFFPEIFSTDPELKKQLDREATAVDVAPHWAIYRFND